MNTAYENWFIKSIVKRKFSGALEIKAWKRKAWIGQQKRDYFLVRKWTRGLSFSTLWEREDIDKATSLARTHVRRITHITKECFVSLFLEASGGREAGHPLQVTFRLLGVNVNRNTWLAGQWSWRLGKLNTNLSYIQRRVLFDLIDVYISCTVDSFVI